MKSKSWPKSRKREGHTIEQKRIMQWIRENMDYGETLCIAYIDRNHMRLTDCYCNHHLLTYHSDGSVTMQEIQEAC